jgi:hypothetical protein
MHFQSSTLLGLITTTSAFNLPSSQYLFSNPPTSKSDGFSIPTVHESAVQARRILQLESIGTLSTVFPTAPHATEQRPSDVGGAPIGLMDYFGDCEPSTGNPTILAITIATSFKNVDAGSNITLSMRWHPQDSTWRRRFEAESAGAGLLHQIPSRCGGVVARQSHSREQVGEAGG